MRGDVKYQEPLSAPAHEGQGVFRNSAQEGGPAFNSGYISRGLAVGDVDNDGDPDVVITRLNGTSMLLRNNVGPGQQLDRFRAPGKQSNRMRSEQNYGNRRNPRLVR